MNKVLNLLFVWCLVVIANASIDLNFLMELREHILTKPWVATLLLSFCMGGGKENVAWPLKNCIVRDITFIQVATNRLPALPCRYPMPT